MAPGHHPIFERFERSAPFDDATHHHNFMGSRIAHAFERDLVDGIKSSGRSNRYDLTYPVQQSEDYFEWIDLLTAIDRGRSEFVMIEVGAGYGRWIANAWAALHRRRAGKRASRLIALEANQARFDMMIQNCNDNGVFSELMRCACTPDGGPVLIPCNENYGAHVFKNEQLQAVGEERFPVKDQSGEIVTIEKVPGLRLPELLTGTVDFIDMDIQGAELGVIASCIDQIDRHVRMIHVGTHSRVIDEQLAEIFPAHGWQPRHLFASGQVNETPYGAFAFIDGISSWNNPRQLEA